MIRRLQLALLAALLLCAAPMTASALTLDDVREMVSVGVPDNIIVSTIQSSEEVFNLSPDEIVELTKAGVSSKVIEALQSTAGGETRTTETRPAEEEPRRRDEPTETRDEEPRRRTSDDDGSAGSDDDGYRSRRRRSTDDDASEDDGYSSRRRSRSSRSDRGSEDQVKRTPKELKEAIGRYKDRRYASASLQLYRMVEEGKYPEIEYKINYYLGDSLYKLGLLHSAQVYFQKVVKDGAETGAYYSNSLARLVRISDKTRDPIYLIKTIHKIDPDDFPGKVKDDLYYYLGVADFERGDMKAAKRAFARLDSNSQHYAKARYYIGVIQNEQGKQAAAAKTFASVLNGSFNGDPDDIARVKQLSLINIARVYYAAEQFSKSADYYEKLANNEGARGGEYWGTALFESSWAYFMSENRESKALGHLLTLSSPFFDRDFVPDAAILEALTYYRICEFDEVQVRLDEFKARYVPIKETIEGLLPTDSADINAARDLYLDLYGKGSKDFRKLPLGVFARLEADRTFQGPHNRVLQIQRELQAIAAMKPQWRDAEVGRGLVKQLEAQAKLYKKFAGAALANKLGQIKDHLADLLGQEALLRFEMVSGEYEVYLEKFQNPETAETDEQFQIDFATNPDKVYWPFNGEFWQDELGYYERIEPGACKE